jgi:hypothetical protein
LKNAQKQAMNKVKQVSFNLAILWLLKFYLFVGPNEHNIGTCTQSSVVREILLVHQYRRLFDYWRTWCSTERNDCEEIFEARRRVCSRRFKWSVVGRDSKQVQDWRDSANDFEWSWIDGCLLFECVGSKNRCQCVVGISPSSELSSNHNWL